MRFRILGPLEVVGEDDNVIEVRGGKVRALLGVLLLRAGRPVSAEFLSEVVWGDSRPSAAANALQAQISKLRRLLPGNAAGPSIETRDGAYVLAVGRDSIDANRFVDLAEAGRASLDRGDAETAAATFREALALWRGPALVDFVDDEFADGDRVRLDELRLTTLEDRLDVDLLLGHHDALVSEIEGLLSDNPLRERFWGQLMLALYRSGRQSDALRAFQRARDHLGEELGLDPGPELRRLEQQILDHDPAIAAPFSTKGQRSSNLPIEISTFVGRDAQLRELGATVRQRRLVTVTGPGGVGKTRLALETAIATSGEWRDGTWLVELGQSTGRGAVVEAFASTFGRRLGLASRTSGRHEESTSDIAWLVEGLADTELLIVLDNCEHVLDSVPLVVAALLRSCEGVHVLATSRTSLDIPGEVVRRLDPLDLDDAVVLFAARARDSSADFVLDDDSAPSVMNICSRVDRLPLAIELAAARTKAFSVQQLSKLLRERFELVSSAAVGRPARQQTLRAAVEWSHDLLVEDERRLFRRLSAFAGGFTLHAAIRVCADDTLRAEVVDVVLAALVDKSLVVGRGPAGAPERFHMLKSVADYATDRLGDSGEMAAVRDRHLAWITDLTRGLTAGLRGPEAVEWVTRINAEIRNLGRAVQWGLSHGDASVGLELGVQLGWYAFVSANIQTDKAVLRLALDAAPDAPIEVRCRALMWAGLLTIGRETGRTWVVDAIDVAPTATGERSPTHVDRDGVVLSLDAVELGRRIGDPALLIETIAIAALHVARDGHQSELALRLIAEARSVGEPVRDAWHLLMVTAVEGLDCFGRGVLDEASRLLEIATDGFRNLGDEGAAALFEISRSEVAEFTGDISGACAALGRALDVATAGHFQSSLILKSELALLLGRDGEIVQALELGREGLAAAHPPFNPVARARALFALGVAERLAGSDDLAAQHLGEAFEIHGQFDMKRELAMDQTQLGYLAIRRGDSVSALRHHCNAVGAAAAVGQSWTLMLSVRGLAETSIAAGDVVVGCRALGFCEAIGLRKGYRRTNSEQLRLADTRVLAVGRIGNAAAAAEDEGSTMTVDALLVGVG